MNLKKRVLMVVLMASIIIVPAKAVQFLDVTPNYWGYEAIMEFAQKGYLSGYEDGTFKPDFTITRAEFAHVINNYFGFTGNENVVTTLSDVDQNEWYAKGINEAVARGYMIGYEDGTFRPNTPITRQEAIVVLAKILNLNDNTSSSVALEYLKSKFSDYSAVEPWALNAVYNFSNLGYINGYEDGTLRIGTSMTRAEVVHMIKPVEQKIVVEKEETVKPNKGGSGGGGGSSSSKVTYYTITVNETTNGTVTASATRVEKGNSVTVTITPAEGYELAELLDNGQVVSAVNGIYTIANVQANHTISATFSLIPQEPEQPEEPVVKYTITATSNEKGTAIADMTEVEEGNEVKITVTPGAAYRLYTLTDNGNDVTANVVDGVYTISDVQENHEVIATFGCNCEECVAKLIETIKGIVDNHADIFVKKLEALKGNVEAIETEIEAVLGQDVETSEYKAEIEAVIAELESADYKGLSDKALATIEKIVCSEKFESALSKIESVLPDKQKEEIKVLLNKIESKINTEVDNIKVEVKDFIENHDCAEVQAFITKIDNKLQSIDSMEMLIDEVEKYIKANVSREDIEKALDALANNSTIQEIKDKLQNDAEKIVEEITNKIIKAKEYQAKIEEVIATLKEIKDSIPTEAELKAMAEELLAKGEATLETLKAKLEEKIAQREAKIQEVIEQIKAEIKENLPTEAELRAMAEELLAKNQAKLDTLKEKLIAKLKGELEDVSDKWEEYVEQIKEQIIANLPSEEVFDDLISKVDSVLPQIEEMTGIEFSEIAAKLGIDADSVSEAIESITQNEALKELVVNTLKDKVSDLIANELSNNDTIKTVLNKVYDAAEKDVADAIIELGKKDTTGITVKIILANTDLEDVLAAIDEDITDEDLEMVVKSCTDYYGLAQFIQTVDSCSADYSAKELIKVALKNANAEELVKLVADNKTQEIILSYLDAEEIIEVLGDLGKEILGDKLEDILGGSIEEALTFTTVTYDANAKNVSGKTKDSTHNKFFGVALTSNGFTRDGYTFKGWATSKNGNVEYEEGKSLKSTDFNSTEVTLYAVWEANTYIITSWADENGNSVTAKATATTDEEVEVNVVEAEWYDIVEIKVNGKKVTGNSFVMPAEDAEIIATAVYTYVPPTAHAIKVTSTINGSVIPNVTSAIEDTEVTITVSPDTGYELDTLVVNSQSGEITLAENKFTMPNEEVEIVATFKAIKYDVEVTTTDLATVTASLDEATIEDTVTITVTNIKEGYELISVTANGNSLEGGNGVYSFEMYADNVVIEVEIEAIDYTVTINGEIPDGCSATVNLKDSIADANVGDTITVICKAALGYRAKITLPEGLASTDTSTADYASKTFKMPAGNVVITVTFTEIPVNTVTVASGIENGTITVCRDIVGDYTTSIQAEAGETVYVSAIPSNVLKYRVASLTANGKKITDNKFTMPSEPVIIEATFEEIIYGISVDECENGTVVFERRILGVSDKITTAYENETVHIVVNANDRWQLADIIITDENDNDITVNNLNKASGTASFVMPAASVNVVIAFEEVQVEHTVSIKVEGNGTIEIRKESGEYGTNTLTGVKNGEKIYVKYKAGSKYAFNKLSATPTVSFNDEDSWDELSGATVKSFVVPTLEEDTEIVVTAEFIRKIFNIEVVDTDGGIVEVAKEKEKGKTVQIEAYKDGYMLKNVTVSGIDDSELTKDFINGKASFKMPDEDVEISVEFEEILEGYTITVDPNIMNGTITVDVSGEIAAKREVTIKAEPSWGYSISEAILKDKDGNVKGKVSLSWSLKAWSYIGTFEMYDCDIIITGTFTK